MKSKYLTLMKGNLNCEMHINSEPEILFVESGEVSVKGELGTETVAENEAVLIFPYQLHGYKCTPEAKASVFMFSYSIAEDFYYRYKTDNILKHKFYVEKPVFEFIKYSLYNFNAEADQYIVKSIFYAFSTAFLQQNTMDKQKNTNSISMQKLMEYIFLNISEELTLQKLSAELGINQKALGSFFKDTVGRKFTDFINNVRIENAKTLLLKNNMTMTEIAYECGFGSVRSFNRAFSKLTDKTPTEYRRNLSQ